MNHRHDRERDIQHRVAVLYETTGAFVAWTSQWRTGPVRVTPGLPDLIVLLPRGKGTLFHEVKAEKGRQREAQIAFQHRCRMSGSPYVLGGEDEARQALIEMGILAA